LLGARQDAGAAQAVDGRMVSVVGLDVPIDMIVEAAPVASTSNPILGGLHHHYIRI
jgi:hypothetical protein